ncbi:hypothetical protein VTK73DRAFT_9860 [Phialemonium thermophilum]|uniref:Uncharacterized protein n=1 Tax=Phialemonium thermophilum TaxID=223376 RepID=A0ABR3XIF0_9PEZI
MKCGSLSEQRSQCGKDAEWTPYGSAIQWSQNLTAGEIARKRVCPYRTLSFAMHRCGLVSPTTGVSKC